MNAAIRRLIRSLKLRPHPEGGYFRETYRCAETVCGGRTFCTAIYFLLPEGERSALHRIKSDEIWHFYGGGPLTIGEIFPSGRTRRTVLGLNFGRGQRPQYVVTAGNWFGAVCNPGSKYSLVGCTVAPGFDFKDLELGRSDELLRRFPGAKTLIKELAP
jgi:predicted cupin superfamily sugar epimerase